jgi:hypothetical protein
VIGGLVGMMAAWNLRAEFCRALCVHRGRRLSARGTCGSALRDWSFAEFIRPIRKFLDSYIEMTADLTLLLATLAIMTGALVITGVRPSSAPS